MANFKIKKGKRIPVTYHTILMERRSKSWSHLPIEQAVYVPSTFNNKQVSKEVLQKRINKVKSYLADKFGGFSSVKVEGGYRMDNGKLVSEPVVRVVAFSSSENFQKNRENFFRQMERWGKQWGQESIGYEFEGDMFFINNEKFKQG